MDFEKELVKKWLGPNLEKGKRNYNNEHNRAVNDFKAKYPFADDSKFEFWVNINNKGEIDESTQIVYTSGKKGARLYNETGTTWKGIWDIKSPTFRNKYQSNLFWGPTDGIFQPTTEKGQLSIGSGQLGFDLQQFPIYVSETLFFSSNFEALVTKWEGKQANITKANFDYENDPYLASLCAAYVLFVKAGISKHLETRDDVPHIITSILRYFVYYHMKRFLTRPRLMVPFLTQDDLTTIQSNIPTRKIWTNKRKSTKETISLFYKEKREGGKEVKAISWLV